MKMTPALLLVGGLLVFWASISIMVFIPAATFDPAPSDIWRPLTPVEQEGHRLFVHNGCVYCHSQYIRILDRGHGANRIAQAGDYVGREPPLLGTERTGPDLSQEGGERPDDWHVGHFTNPRFTSPLSLMPSWEFLGQEKIAKLIAYMQAEGGRGADTRVARQNYWKAEAVAAHRAGPDQNIQWLHGHVPEVWQNMPNPYPASQEALLRGKKTYQEFCIGCHSTVGDGAGPAAPFLDPPPLNFTTLRRNLVQGKYIGGILYYQIMNGITGTSMPYFKRFLESEKIWDVSNYVAVYFIGYTDAGIEPKGIDVAYQGEWFNPYLTPREADRAGTVPFTTTRSEPNGASGPEQGHWRMLSPRMR
jgi:cbb3-type cytochrome c oxidase subunit II